MLVVPSSGRHTSSSTVSSLHRVLEKRHELLHIGTLLSIASCLMKSSYDGRGFDDALNRTIALLFSKMTGKHTIDPKAPLWFISK